MRKKLGLDFPILIDGDLQVSRRFGLANESHGGVPHPALLILDADGIVRHLRVDEKFRQRPSPDEVLEALRAVQQSSPAQNPSPAG